MEKRVSKAEQKLSNYARRVGMSEPGKHWLMAAIDPFHDKPLAIAGYPDGTPGKSLVQCIRLSADVSKPAALPTGATWDVLLTTSNFLTTHTLGPFKGFSWGVYQKDNAPTLFNNITTGGLTINKAISGTDLSISLTSVATQSVSNLQIPAEFLEGRLRVLSHGFEVSNTTADLYKNGSVTVFEVPQELPEERFSVVIGNQTGITPPTGQIGSITCLRVARMPSSLAQATQITGSQTWEAKDGVYCVARQNGLFNPATSPKQVSPYVVFNDSNRPYPQVPADVAILDNSPGGNSIACVAETFKKCATGKT